MALMVVQVVGQEEVENINEFNIYVQRTGINKVQTPGFELKQENDYTV